MNESATNHVTGLENGRASYWWEHTYPFEEGTQTDEDSSSVPWNRSYDTVVSFAGFHEAAYYGMDYGGGREEYFAYLGDEFSDGTPGSSGGMFGFAFGDGELTVAVGGGGALQQNGLLAAQLAISAAGGVESEATNRDRLLPGAPGQDGIHGNTSYRQGPGRGAQRTASEQLSSVGGGTDTSGESVVVTTTGDGGGGGFLDWLQGGLDVAGLFPGLGEVADGTNVVISLFRGDWTGAGLSAVSMIPGWGDAIGKGGKLARYAAKYRDEVAALKGLNKAAHTAEVVRSFKSFDALKAALGPAAEGKVWHHIVEQRPSNVARFGPEAIHNTANVVAVQREVNQKIADYYSKKQPFTGGKTVREWLDSQSYEKQKQFGLMILQRVIEGKPLP